MKETQIFDLPIPKSILKRVTARRGRIHILEDLEPPRTALLVVDMQNAYLAPGAPGFVAGGQRIVPGINSLARAIRTRSGIVVWLRNTLGANTLQSWSTYGYFREGKIRERMLNALEAGAIGHEIWGDMDVQNRDLIINKCRYSAFIAGSSDLEDRLRERSIDTVIIAGLLANVCCESTARDAMMLNFKVIMAADALAAHSEEELNATLANILFVFGDVMTCDHLTKLVERTSAVRET